MNDVARTSVDCKLAAGLSDAQKKKLVKATRGVITGARCTVPLAFDKAPVYAEVLKAASVSLPKLKVTCEINDITSDEPARASAVLRPKCARAKPAKGAVEKTGEKAGKTPPARWSCVANVGNLEGLGMFGGVFERLANDSDTVKRAMAKFMEQVEGAARKGRAASPDHEEKKD